MLSAPKFIFSMLVVVPSLFAQGFALPADCSLSFASIKTTDLEIDAPCTVDGNAGDDTGKKLESNAKNDFCVTGKPVPYTCSNSRSWNPGAPSNSIQI